MGHDMGAIRAAAVIFAGVSAVAITLSGCTSSPARVENPDQGDGSSVASSNPWPGLAMQGYEVEHYDSLGGMTELSNAVVVGTVQEASRGTMFVSAEGDTTEAQQLVVLRLSIDEYVTGDMAEGRQDVDLEFGPYPVEQLTTEFLSQFVGQTGVFSLRRKGVAVPELNLAGSDKQFAANAYRVVNSQGLLIEVGDTVEAPLVDEESFVSDLEGLTINEVVEAIEESEAVG